MNYSSSQDSKGVAEYYQVMHTDPLTGKRPYLVGLKCRHGKGHMNNWFIQEDSNDNKNGVIFRGKGPSPDNSEWVRDSRKVEIIVKESDADWNSVLIRCRSELTGEEIVVTPLRVDLKISGIPANLGDNANYPAIENGKGRCFRFDASKLFPGAVTVLVTAKNREGKVIRDLSLRYYDIRDFAFSAVGPDGVSDEKVLEEDVLGPVRKFLEDPANALPNGTLLKEHILYIVLVHGMPYSAKGVFGIEHGATSKKYNHGTLASLEQRLQTLYYGWESFRPPVISMYMTEGPDSGKGAVNHVITTAMRSPLTGTRWNPYMHPDTYSFLGKDKKKAPVFPDLLPLPQRRKALPPQLFAYGVTRIDGTDAEEAKRLIDYAVYATKYLRPEMDCYVRSILRDKGAREIINLTQRLESAEKGNLWGHKELETLGFRVISDYDQGLPFMVRPPDDLTGNCKGGAPDWGKTGFYPGGIGRQVVSHNGWNMTTGPIWVYLKKGVTVSACGAPAYGGGPHITNATFWDSRILMRYLFRGRDLGECFLLSTIYINWSTSLIGDPLMHPDLRHTVIDRTPPTPLSDLSIKFTAALDKYTAEMSTELKYDPHNPEVAVLTVICKDIKGNETIGVSPLYSRRPRVVMGDLRPDTDYVFKAVLTDPYGNRTELPAVSLRTKPVNPMSTIKGFFDKVLGK